VLLEIGELDSHFISFTIQHVIRSANNAAHLCAKHASTLIVTDCWLDVYPSFLVSTLLADGAMNISVE
jgi:hypothetical protein